MDIVWLEDFLALAMERNFSRAAENRNLSQPAFSRRIKGLEEWVGARLIDRDTHRIALTEAGVAFQGVAEDVLRRLALGRDEAREISGEQTEMIRFVATQSLAVTFFPAWLKELGEKGSLGPISLIADAMVACENLLLDGDADFLLCHAHPAAKNRLEETHFRWVRLGEDELIPISAPENGAPKFALSRDATARLPFLAFDERSGLWHILKASILSESTLAGFRTVFRSHLASALLNMARNGMGVTWTPLSLCRDDLDAGRLVRAGGDEWSVPLEIRLFRPRSRRNAAVEELWSFIAQGGYGK